MPNAASGYEYPRLRRVIGRVIEIDHLELPKTQETILTAAMAAAAVAATVLDNRTFASGQLALIGDLGYDGAEIIQVTGTSSTNSVTTAASSYAHASGSPIRRVLFNQWRVYGNSTNSSTGATLIATINADVSSPFTTYVNTGTQYTFYLVVPYDSVNAVAGENYSDGVAAATGYAADSVQTAVQYAIDHAKRPLPENGFLWAVDTINTCLQTVRGKLRHWTNLQTYDASIGATARGTNSFALPSDMYDTNSNRSVLGFRIGDGKNITWKDKREWEDLLNDVAYTQIRTAASAYDRILAIDNSLDFDDSNTAGTYLVGYWKFDENTGTTAYDSSGNGNNAAITGAAYATGRSGQALDFDGDDDVVTVTDATAVQNVWDTGGSISFWINPDSDGEGDAGRIIEKSAWEIVTRTQSGSNLSIRLTVGFSTTSGTWDTAVNIPIDTWTHVVITYNADAVLNNPIIYINGTSATFTETVTPVGTRTTDVGSNLSIGNLAATTRTFDGTIDEVRMYNRILSTDEVSALYNNPGGGSHSVSVYVNGVKHTINYTDVFYSATAGILLGVPFSGTGYIPETLAVDSNVWQDEDEGTPKDYTIYDGRLYHYPLVDSSHDNMQATLDYFNEIVEVESPADTLSYVMFPLVRHYLTWMLRGQDNPGGKPDLQDGDYALYREVLSDLIQQEIGRTGKYRMKPNIINVTSAT